MVAHEFTRMGTLLVPYMKPHIVESPLAQQIVKCVETNHPCI